MTRWVTREGWSALLPGGSMDLDEALAMVELRGGEWVVDISAPFGMCGRLSGEQSWTYASREAAVAAVDRWFAGGLW